MTNWKEWHIELNEAIEKPTNGQLIDMDKKHFKMYSLSQKIQIKKEELSELEEEFKDLKETLNPQKLPNWAWTWIMKKSRVSWKQVVINKLGKTYANKISAEAKQKKYPQIGIQFIDPDPEKIPIDPEKKEHQEKPARLNLVKQQKTPLLKLKLR
jgi:hypothetical protein